MLNSAALTKVQSIILVTVIAVATLAGGATYFLPSGENQFTDTIKIGVLADLDASIGEDVWKGAVFAVEQINAAGGILGLQRECHRRAWYLKGGQPRV